MNYSHPSTCALSALFAFAGWLYADSALALPSDAEQPTHIQADAAVIDDTKGSSVYTGNVVIDQGTLHINADEVRVITDADNIVVQIVARNFDKVARFEQQPKLDREKVRAEARTISYFVQEERLHLTGDARLRQSKDLFEGELLYYDVGAGILNLERGADGSRVRMVLNPRTKTSE